MASPEVQGGLPRYKIFTDLQARGCEDILIAVTGGLTGMGEVARTSQF